MRITKEAFRGRFLMIIPPVLIIFIAVVFIAAFLVVSRHYTDVLFERIESGQRAGLAQLISIARNAMEPVIEKVRTGEISREEAIEEVRPLIRSMTYRDQYGDNYIVMNSYDGTTLVHPYEPEREMKSDLDLRDANGLYIVRELIMAAKSHPEGSFIKYNYYLPQVYDTQEKITYVLGIPEIECYIATGMYMQKRLLEQEEILSKVKYASVILVIAVFIPAVTALFIIISRNRRLQTEIRAREEIGETLIENEAKWRSIFENTGIGIHQTAPDGRFISVNPAFAATLGYASPKEMIAGNATMIQHYLVPEERRTFLELLKEKGVISDHIMEMRRRDGRTIWASITGRVVRDTEGKVLYYEGSMEDITRRKTAEDEVRNARKMLDNILSAASEISIVATDSRGIITVFNRGAELMLGYNPGEIIGIHTPLILHDDLEIAARGRKMTAELGYPVEGFHIVSLKPKMEGRETVECTFVRKDGSRLPVSLAVYAIRSETGEFSGVVGIATDITNRKRSEVEIRRLASIVRHSSELVSLAELDGQVVFLNEAGASMLGIDPPDVERTNFMQVIPGYMKEVVETEMFPRVMDGGVWEGDLQYLNLKTGAVTDVHAMSFPIDDPDALYKRYLANVSFDISRRRQAEEKFTNIFMMAPDGISITRLRDGLIMETSMGFKEMTGRDRSDVVGRTSLEVNFWADTEDRRFLFEELKAGRHVIRHEFRFRRKDGVIRYGIYSARLIRIAGEDCVIFVMQDITERRDAEEMSRLLQEKFMNIFMMTPDMIAITRLTDGRIVDVNMGFEDITGWGREEVTGRTSSELNFWADPEARVLMVEELRSGRDMVRREISFRRKDGSLRTGIYAARIIDIQGDAHLIFVMQDITERRRLEEEHGRLEQQIIQSQRLDAIGKLAGGVAHDFNNILMGIQGNAALSMMEFNPENPHYRRMSSIEEHVKRGANLTRQLLGFAREGKYDLRTLSANDLLRKSAGFFIETHKEIDAEFRLQEGLYPVKADAGQLEQVFLNIFINAGHAMPAGGRITIRTSDTVLHKKDAEVLGLRPGRYIRISISDTGTGMDRENLKRIFEPFYTTKPKDMGTGLGLASAYGIIKNHGGAIEAESEPGEGSTFNIYLPSSGGEVEDEEDLDTDKGVFPGKGGILVIDDEPSILEIATKFLSTLGYTVYQAENAQDAIAVYRQKQGEIDLVILDMVLKGTIASKVLKTLKEINRGVKVILSSGYGLQGEVQKVLEMGCIDFMPKPYNFSELSRTVHRALERQDGTE